MKSLKALIENMIEHEKIIVGDNGMRSIVIIKQNGTYKTRYRSMEYISGVPRAKEAQVLINIQALDVYALIIHHFHKYEIHVRW